MTRCRPRWWCAITARRIRRLADDPPGRVKTAQPVPIEEVVTPAPRVKPQLLPMSMGRTPDVFHGQFSPDSVGLWTFRVDGWGDPIATWRKNVTAKLDAGQSESELSNDLLIGARLLERAATGVPRQGRYPLIEAAARLREPGDPFTRAGAALSPDVTELLEQYPLRELVTRGEQYGVWVDRPLARFSSWYEIFPRSTGGWDAKGNPVHGTFATATKALPRIAKMGFDVVYLPPIHPIGKVHRKGRNNSVTAAPNDVGSPWAIGSDEGGHDAIHPKLGTIEDFDDFVAAARDDGMEVALDLALQCAPDHPWARKHPEWFTVLPDGTIAYAENPPKKYQDIYPLNFDNDPAGLYEEVLRVVRFWISHGVKVFRVDNPHTKPPNFWAWLIGEVKNEDPDVLFLSEAFTRPARLYGLAKLGFTQSYTYFTWRTAKWELTEFGQQIAEHADYARPNLFVNTPDILHESLQHGGPGMFAIRAVLASTMSSAWGVYSGYELFEHRAGPGRQRGVPELGEVRTAPPRLRGRAGRRRIAGAVPDPAQRDSSGASRAARVAHHQVPPPRQRRAAGLQQVRPGDRRSGAGGGDAQPVRPGRGDAVAGHGRAGDGALRPLLGARRDHRRRIPMGAVQLRSHRPGQGGRPRAEHAPGAGRPTTQPTA